MLGAGLRQRQCTNMNATNSHVPRPHLTFRGWEPENMAHTSPVILWYVPHGTHTCGRLSSKAQTKHLSCGDILGWELFTHCPSYNRIKKPLPFPYLISSCYGELYILILCTFHVVPTLFPPSSFDRSTEGKKVSDPKLKSTQEGLGGYISSSFLSPLLEVGLFVPKLD